MKENIKKTVKDRYGKIAKSNQSCCGTVSSCCGGSEVNQIGKGIGYSDREMASVPVGANLGLGCGNPTALASLAPGETVLDLGSGAGFDCFLAAGQVGPGGKVFGLDMTPAMVDKAKENARRGGHENVEFLLGEIEQIPLPDESVDVIISNCVINLSPNKPAVFKEAFRVLKPAGRLMVSDIVLTAEIPESLRSNVAAYVGCISGALLKDQYLALVKETGFERVEPVAESRFEVDCRSDDPTSRAIVEDESISSEQLEALRHKVFSISVTGYKPGPDGKAAGRPG